MFRIELRYPANSACHWLSTDANAAAAFGYVSKEVFAEIFDSFQSATVFAEKARHLLEVDASVTVQERIDGVTWVRCNYQPIDVIVNDLVELKIG